MEITREKIESLAPNAAAAKNGYELVAKGRFSNLRISSERDLIWGECAGSAENPYFCSADFADENNPVFRCSCPSRQFPCKHALGLLYAYEKNSRDFVLTAIPGDILQKREKTGKRQASKAQETESVKEKTSTTAKINTSAVIKKTDTQLAGIELAGKLLGEIVRTGLSSLDAKMIKTLQGQVKELGNYYINGVQTAFNDLLLELGDVKGEEYTPVIDRINYISALLKKAADCLNRRKDNPEAPPELDSAIEEQTGYVWKLTELMQYGLYEENAELLQLSFNCFDDPARRELVDEGIWFNLKSGRIYKTKNYRPYRAVRYIQADNSFFGVLRLREMFIYPGDRNPRVRWETDAVKRRNVIYADRQKIYEEAAGNYQEMIKSVKQMIKNPLMDKNPVVLIKVNKSFMNGENLVAEDLHGNKLTLRDLPGYDVAPAVNLQAFLPARPEKTALAVMIHNDVQTGLLYARPLSLITPEKIIRLLY